MMRLETNDMNDRKKESFESVFSFKINENLNLFTLGAISETQPQSSTTNSSLMVEKLFTTMTQIYIYTLCVCVIFRRIGQSVVVQLWLNNKKRPKK